MFDKIKSLIKSWDPGQGATKPPLHERVMAKVVGATSAERPVNREESKLVPLAGVGVPTPMPAPAPTPAPAATAWPAPPVAYSPGPAPVQVQAAQPIAPRQIKAQAAPEEACGIHARMSKDEIKARLALLYRRYNRATSSLDMKLRAEAEDMLDAIVAVREKVFGPI